MLLAMMRRMPDDFVIGFLKRQHNMVYALLDSTSLFIIGNWLVPHCFFGAQTDSPWNSGPHLLFNLAVAMDGKIFGDSFG